MTISAKMNLMNGAKNKYLMWLLGFTILLSCLVGVGLWLPTDSIVDSLTTKVSSAYSGQGHVAARPEIDLQVPETTEIALFAVG